ncbi:MAG: hypothetical protein M3O71_23830 [Bacteroidota bacterium]|nr:hypothetical protein [Bacteroidota bacterium]
MTTLNDSQASKLDLILNAFGKTDHIESDKVLLIEPSERKANALIDILKQRGFINRIGDTEENLLPIIITLNSSADVFLESGGFQGELKRINLQHQGTIGTQINIHSTGYGNLINTGNNNNITNYNKADERSLDDLKESLSSYKVANEDIEELSAVIVSEEPIDNRFGPKVKGWLAKMINKSIEGTWEIGLATAGGILTEILKKYYGF